jgi:N-acetylneuraminate synthase
MKIVKIGNKRVGKGCDTFVVAEIGINHNGDLKIAKKMIDAAKAVGCDAVKLQKRTPDICVPLSHRKIMRETPWGPMTYMDYRYKIEFEYEDYLEIDRYCNEKEICWFASCWDKVSVDLIDQFNPPCYKIPSALLTDDDLLKYTRSRNKPVILSTGMSTQEQIDHAVEILGINDLIILQSTSTYPCKIEELNLRVIQTFSERYNCPIGYSGHEVGISTTIAAAALGAKMIERHLTLDRSMWGSDQSASVEPEGLEKIVKYIHANERAMGNGKKKVYDDEIPVLKKLRRVVGNDTTSRMAFN